MVYFELLNRTLICAEARIVNINSTVVSCIIIWKLAVAREITTQYNNSSSAFIRSFSISHHPSHILPGGVGVGSFFSIFANVCIDWKGTLRHYRWRVACIGIRRKKIEEGRWQGRYSLTAPTHTPGRRIVREHVCVRRGGSCRFCKANDRGRFSSCKGIKKRGRQIGSLIKRKGFCINPCRIFKTPFKRNYYFLCGYYRF